MSRRHKAEKREIFPDPKYRDEVVSKFMNNLMVDGKKSIAEKIVYGAFDQIEGKLKTDPIKVFHDAIDNVMPSVEVRSERRKALAIRWIIAAARSRSEDTMGEKLSSELIDASNNRGSSVKKREDTHKMAEANRAFSHYRW